MVAAAAHPLVSAAAAAADAVSVGVERRLGERGPEGSDSNEDDGQHPVLPPNAASFHFRLRERVSKYVGK